MIRVLIIASSLSRAREIAAVLEEDDRIEVLDTQTLAYAGDSLAGFADVVVAAGVSADRIPIDGARVVALIEHLEEFAPSQQVRAWLPDNVSSAELIAAIAAVANDFTVLTAGQARTLWHGVPPRSGTHRDLEEPLTAREREVLRKLADGLGNKEIASELGISEHTAKFHVAQILAKLRAASRTEAVAIGIRLGLVPI